MTSLYHFFFADGLIFYVPIGGNNEKKQHTRGEERGGAVNDEKRCIARLK